MKKIKSILVLIIGCLYYQQSIAQWHFSKIDPLNLPSFTSIIVDQNDSFCTYRTGYGMKGTIKSADGINWYPTNATLGPVDYPMLNILSTSDNYLYASDDNGQLFFRSSDGGVTWTDIESHLPFIGGTPFRLKEDKSGALLMVTILANDPNMSPAIYRSANHGNSWSVFETCVPCSANYILDYVKMGSRSVFTGGDGLIYAGSSLNNGSAKYTTSANGSNNCYLKQIGNKLYAYPTDNGLIVSSDSGVTWQTMLPKLKGDSQIFGISNKGNFIYTWSSRNFFYSTDDGNSFKSSPFSYDCKPDNYFAGVDFNSKMQGLASTYQTESALVFDTLTNLWTEIHPSNMRPPSYSIYGDVNENLAAIYSSGIYTYANNEWKKQNCEGLSFGQINKKGRALWVNDPRYSADNGISWISFKVPEIYNNSSHWFADISSFYFLNPDTFLFVYSDYDSMGANPYRNRDTIFYTANGGTSYQKYSFSNLSQNNKVIGSLYVGNKLLLLIGKDDFGEVGEIWSTLDFGKTWNKENVPGSIFTSYSFVSTENYAFTGDIDINYYSSNAAHTWDTISNLTGHINKIIEIPSSKSFLLQSDSIIYLLKDFKTSNPKVLYRTNSGNIIDFALINEHLYILTNDKTILRSDETAEVKEVNTLKNNLLHIFPVPSKDFIHISHEQGDKLLTYEIFDLSGKAINMSNLNDGMRIDIRSFEEGLYFIKIVYTSGKFAYGKFIKN